MPRKLKIGTVFSGIGSFEHALNRLKIPHIIKFACDNNKFVKKSYLANYNIKDENWYDDIVTFNASKYKYKVDIVVGGSPCQSFSTVGKQLGLEDPRGNLIFEFIRIINETRPKLFIFENVKGLLSNNKKKTFEIVLKKFETLNYDIKYSVLNAVSYGIPQSRQRLFLIGTRKNKKINITFPPPEIKLEVKMQDFLEDNIANKYYMGEKGQNHIVWGDNIKKKKTQINGRIALCQRKNQQFNWFGDFIFEYRTIPDKYYLSDKIKAYVLKSGTKGFYSKPKTDLEIARPILSTVAKMHRAGVDNYITKYGKIRKLTPRECLRLMGFSDNFKICVSDTQCYKQAGNSIVVNIFIAILKNTNLMDIL